MSRHFDEDMFAGSRARRRRKKRQRRGRLRRRLLGLAAFLCLMAAAAAAAAGLYVKDIVDSTPKLSALPERSVGQNSVVFAADGSRLGFIRSDVLRTPVPAKRLPQNLKDAVVAVEDRRFFEHEGVDWVGVARAAWADLTAGEARQGASTLTMQLVRNLYFTNEKSLERKIAEAKLASDLEDVHSKSWILWKYIDNAPFGAAGGQELVGAGAAARVFFNKDVRRLTLAQAALLAGLPQAPTAYNPLNHPRAARARRNVVLDAMLAENYISTRQWSRATRAPVKLDANRFYTRRRERYFFDYVRAELEKRYGKKLVERGGLRVYTTVQPKLQTAARAAISAELYEPDDPASAVVSVNPANGHIRAMASSTDYKQSNFNLAAQGRRQPGSTFKPIDLLAAMRDHNADPDTTYYSSRPLLFDHPEYGRIDVSTYDGSYVGTTSLASAMLRSDNSVYSQLTLDVGPKAVRKMARDMGIRSPLQATPSLGLGGLEYGVSPLEMATAYATIASGGVRRDPTAVRRVVLADGKRRRLKRRKPRRAFSAGIAGEVREILADNMVSGTGTGAAISCASAGKTGTTDSYKDAWFVGFTPKLATSVWVGYPKAGVPMTSVHGITVSGSTFPASIWRRFMTVATAGQCAEFPEAPAPDPPLAPYCGPYSTCGSAVIPYTPFTP